MIDAFGVDISKGLPSYVKGVQLGKIKPKTNSTGLGRVYRADLIRANEAGKKAAAMKPDNMRQRLISEIPKSFSTRNRPRERFQTQVKEGQRLKRRLPGYLKVNKDIKAARETTKAKYDSTYLDENRMSAQDLIWHRATNMAPRRRNVSKAFTPRNPDFSMQGREVLHLGRKARIHTYDGDNMFTVLNHRDNKVFVHRDQLKFLKKKRSESSVKPLVPSKPPKPVQGTLFDIGKSFVPRSQLGAINRLNDLNKPTKLSNPYPSMLSRTPNVTAIKATVLKEKQPKLFQSRLKNLRNNQAARLEGKPDKQIIQTQPRKIPFEESPKTPQAMTSKTYKNALSEIPKSNAKRFRVGFDSIQPTSKEFLRPSAVPAKPETRSSQIVIASDNLPRNAHTERKLLHHELAHATGSKKGPKRRWLRLNQIVNDPRKVGREEARVEHLTGTKKATQPMGTMVTHYAGAYEPGLLNPRSPEAMKNKAYRGLNQKLESKDVKPWKLRSIKNT